MIPTLHHLGSTRSVSRREFLLHTPDAFVRTPLPGLTGGTAIVHTAPQGGAGFSMSTMELAAGGTLTTGPVQRFLYVLHGEIALQDSGPQQQSHTLQPGGFAFLPTAHPHSLTTAAGATLLLFEKPFQPLLSTGEQDPHALPHLLLGHEPDIPATALNGDDALQVRILLPATDTFDFAVNTMTYQPGTSLAQVEVHWMEHGLLMLEGGGIYRLADEWHPVTAGDVIWMAPFCPQWFAAVGKQPAKYLIYKDFNRHVLA